MAIFVLAVCGNIPGRSTVVCIMGSGIHTIYTCLHTLSLHDALPISEAGDLTVRKEPSKAGSITGVKS